MSRDAAKECYVVLKKRISKKTARVALRSLELVEMLVKNCGFQFLSFVARQEFQDDLIEIAKNRGIASPVREKVLTLIMSWAEAFVHMQDVYPTFQQTFAFLRSDPNIEFPARDATAMSPIFTPPISVAMPPPSVPAGNRQQRQPGSANPARTQGSSAAPSSAPIQQSNLSNVRYQLVLYLFLSPTLFVFFSLIPFFARFCSSDSPIDSQELSAEYQEKIKFELQSAHNLMLMTREILAASAGDGWLLIKNNEMLSALAPKLRRINKRINALLQELTVEALVTLSLAVSDYINQTLTWYAALSTDKPCAPPQPLMPLLEISSDAAGAADAVAIAAAAGATGEASAASGKGEASSFASGETDILGLHAPIGASQQGGPATAAASSASVADADEDPFASLDSRDSVRAALVPCQYQCADCFISTFSHVSPILLSRSRSRHCRDPRRRCRPRLVLRHRLAETRPCSMRCRRWVPIPCSTPPPPPYPSAFPARCFSHPARRLSLPPPPLPRQFHSCFRRHSRPLSCSAASNRVRAAWPVRVPRRLRPCRPRSECNASSPRPSCLRPALRSSTSRRVTTASR